MDADTQQLLLESIMVERIFENIVLEFSHLPPPGDAQGQRHFSENLQPSGSLCNAAARLAQIHIFTDQSVNLVSLWSTIVPQQQEMKQKYVGGNRCPSK